MEGPAWTSWKAASSPFITSQLGTVNELNEHTPFLFGRAHSPKKEPISIFGKVLLMISAGAIIALCGFLVVLWLSSSSSSSSSSASSVTTTLGGPESIYGGGWDCVRCVASTEGSWHPATDNLRGTEAYGDVTSWDADETWSTTWSFALEDDDDDDGDGYTQVLLALTNFSYWLVVDAESLFALGAPVEVTLLASSASPDTSSIAQWYIRDGNAEE